MQFSAQLWKTSCQSSDSTQPAPHQKNIILFSLFFKSSLSTEEVSSMFLLRHRMDRNKPDLKKIDEIKNNNIYQK